MPEIQLEEVHAGAMPLPMPPPIDKKKLPPVEHLALENGARINFRPKEEIEHALDLGYLELEVFIGGQTAYQIVRKLDRRYRYSLHYAGQHGAMKPAEFAKVEDLMKHVDLHAFRWYPFF
ncbi:MAG: hypothetical protein ACJ788_00060 [Ktedonobacteraceae bacterium]